MTDSGYRDYEQPRFGEAPPWYAIAVGMILVAALVLVVLIALQNSGGGENTNTLLADSSTSEPATLPTQTSDTASSTASTTASTSTNADSTSTTTATTTTAPATTASMTATSTESSTTTTTTASVDPSLFDSAVWPWLESSDRYTDPTAVALSFAEDYVGFENPIVGPFLQGDSQSGEVEVRSRAGGPVTIVFVRKLGPDQTWWVLGSGTANILVISPDTGVDLASPVTVSGQALAFEGTVDVEIKVDGLTTPIAVGFVTGGGTEMAPFEGTFTFTKPTVDRGAVVLKTLSAEDGSVLEASVRRIAFK